MKAMLQEIIKKCNNYTKYGAVANYIPELAKANPDEFGITIVSSEKINSSAGDYDKYFTMQSVVKPIILLMALMDKGEERVRNLVGVESTGKPFDAFNYSDQALKREFVEETGLEINIDSLYNVIQNDYTACKTNEKVKSVQLIMKVSSTTDNVEISEEHDEYGWFTHEEVKELLENDLLSRAASKSFKGDEL